MLGPCFLPVAASGLEGPKKGSPGVRASLQLLFAQCL
ncbi:hypothetical protein ABIF68_004061 [Bradyrhizobium japonicum]